MIVKRNIVIETKATTKDWTEARRKAKIALQTMTPEEDEAITADAREDADNPLLVDETRFVTFEEARSLAGGRQRVALDGDVVERFKRSGEDWEERINDVLRANAPAE